MAYIKQTWRTRWGRSLLGALWASAISRDTMAQRLDYIETGISNAPAVAISGVIDVTHRNVLPGVAGNETLLRSLGAEAIAQNKALLFPLAGAAYQVDTTEGAIFSCTAGNSLVLLGQAIGGGATTDAATSMIQRTAGTNPIVEWTGNGNTSAGRAYGGARHLILDGGAFAGTAVVVSRANEMTFESVRITNSGGRALHGTQLWNCTFRDCYFWSSGAAGSEPAVLLDSLTGAGTNGGCDLVFFSDCQWEGNRGVDLKIAGSSADTSACSHINLTNTKMESAYAASTDPFLELGYSQFCRFANFSCGNGARNPTSLISVNGTNPSGSAHQFNNVELVSDGTTYAVDMTAGRTEWSNVDVVGAAPDTAYFHAGSSVPANGLRIANLNVASTAKPRVFDERTGGEELGKGKLHIVGRVDGDATLGTVGVGSTWNFADAAANYISTSVQIPPDIVPNSIPVLRILWSSPVTTGDIKWRFQGRICAAAGDVTSSFANDTVATVPGTANTLSITDVNGNAAAPGDVCIIKLIRRGNDGEDTCTNIGQVIALSLVYERRI